MRTILLHGSTLMGACCMTVLIGGKPAWRIGDTHNCLIPNAPPLACDGAPHGPGVTTLAGSRTTIIGGQPAACVGDFVLEPHAIIPLPANNPIMQGEPTVLIG